MGYRTTVPSPIGNLILHSDGQALTGLWMEGQKHFPVLPEDTQVRDDLPLFLTVRAWLDAYFAGQQPDITFSLAPRGSEFRCQVWEILQTIPYGQTTSYAQVARKLEEIRGSRVSAQAVGGAVGHNPISIIIPCHRVVGADGRLTGYAGGLERKIWLLDLERESAI